jgi:hypothetical protein
LSEALAKPLSIRSGIPEGIAEMLERFVPSGYRRIGTHRQFSGVHDRWRRLLRQLEIRWLKGTTFRDDSARGIAQGEQGPKGYCRSRPTGENAVEHHELRGDLWRGDHA